MSLSITNRPEQLIVLDIISVTYLSTGKPRIEHKVVQFCILRQAFYHVARAFKFCGLSTSSGMPFVTAADLTFVKTTVG